MNRIHNAFENVKADDALKQNTADFISKEIAKREKQNFVFKARYAAAAFAVVLCCVLGVVLHSLNVTSVSFISIDVNPSVELSLNCFNNVTAATAYNDDGKVILYNLKLEGMSYQNAVDEILESSEFDSYIKDDSLLTFTVVSDNDEEITKQIESCDNYKKYNGECHSAESKVMDEAHENGLSFGKYSAYLELKEYDDSVTAEQCNKMTMREIRNLIEEHTGSSSHNGGSNSENKNDNACSESNVTETKSTCSSSGKQHGKSHNE